MGDWWNEVQVPNQHGNQGGYGVPDNGTPYPQYQQQGLDNGLGAGQTYNQGFQQPYGNQQQPYGYPQQQYGYQQGPVGSVDRYGFIKYTRAQYIEGLRNYVMRASGKAIMSEERLEYIFCTGDWNSDSILFLYVML